MSNLSTVGSYPWRIPFRNTLFPFSSPVSEHGSWFCIGFAEIINCVLQFSAVFYFTHWAKRVAASALVIQWENSCEICVDSYPWWFPFRNTRFPFTLPASASILVIEAVHSIKQIHYIRTLNQRLAVQNGQVLSEVWFEPTPVAEINQRFADRAIYKSVPLGYSLWKMDIHCQKWHSNPPLWLK